MYYVYSLKCKNGFYIGYTDNIEERLERHSKGHVPATKDRLPINLEFYLAIPDKYKAFKFEKYLKSGSGRAFIKKHLTQVSYFAKAIKDMVSVTRVLKLGNLIYNFHTWINKQSIHTTKWQGNMMTKPSIFGSDFRAHF